MNYEYVPSVLTINGVKVYSVAQFAARAGVSPVEVWSDLNAGYLQSMIINNYMYIAEFELTSFVMRKSSLLV